LRTVKSIGDPHANNWLIEGDNLEALKALLPFFAGQVKCIFIDPPYNTKSAFEHYDDNLEHSQWLSMMYPRLELLRDFLSPEGSIWVTIDDNEAQYLKVLMDEVFGRKNFIGSLVWQKRTSRENRAAISSSHDLLLLYAKCPADQWKNFRNKLPASSTGYANPDGDERGEWKSIPFTAQGYRPNQMYKIETPTGVVHDPPRGRCWAATEPEYLRLRDVEKRIYFPNNGNGRPRVKQFIWEQKGLVPMTIWPASQVGDNEDAKKEILALFSDETPFPTPKPERLIQRILQIATNENDLVLDSFLGSGTTAAVAHKMRRRWIGIEMGEHARTHCLPRLEKVVEGRDEGGITTAAGWPGGGGFCFLELGPSVFNEDGTLNPDVSVQDLAAYIWFLETRTPYKKGRVTTPLLGVHEGTACVLLYNGALGDKNPQGGNVLTTSVWAELRNILPVECQRTVVYGEACKLSESRLKDLNVTFKQIPYHIRMR
jgi:adenine-specific DNA-methyltransferase